MVLLDCSGTGGGIYAKLANGVARHHCARLAALEDKIVQHAVVTILNQIYKEDFLGFSYGFRPGRSQHQALDALSWALVKKKVNYVLDADIQSFFDNLGKAWMIKFVEHRVADRRILRLIQKWLNAVRYTEPGTGVEISLTDSETGGAHRVVLEVNDRGPGIPEFETKDIFRPLYRVDRGRSTETGGFGVGLAIAERAVKLHQGELHASNRPDGGATIRMSFPRLHVYATSG